MYSVSLNQKVGTMVEKGFATMDEDTIIIDAAKVMRDKDISSVFVTKSKKVQEKAFLFLYMNLVEQKNIFYDFINVENS